MKQKKDKYIKGSIFSILIRKYILFTLAIILFGILIFFLARNHMRGIINEPLFNKLISYKSSIMFDRYYNIPVEQLLGKGSLIQVLNEKNEIIYESKTQMAPSEYTDGEISCISEYNEYQIAELTNIANNSSKSYHYKEAVRVLIINHYGKNSNKDCYLLNANNQILNGYLYAGKTSFTEKELGYLTGTYPGRFRLQKYTYKNKDGNKRIMLFLLPILSEKDYKLVAREIRGYAIAFVIFYVILILIFVYIINRQFKKPIKLFNNALLDIAEGKRDGLMNYSGPIEFIKICDSFNIMSKRLSESEEDNAKLTIERSKMLADISHDLKTPITVIQGYTKALSDGLVSEEKRTQYLNIIYKKSVLVGNLINEFYEYSKLDHPEFNLNLEIMNICEFSREYIADKFDELKMNGYQIEVMIPEKEIYIQADSMQIRRVFENLISNTVKHTEKGTTINFEIIVTDKNVIINYYDNGSGISKKIAEHIFEPFVVEDISRNKTGSGLGLSITQKIVQAHGGTIHLLNVEEQAGTCFQIILPGVDK